VDRLAVRASVPADALARKLRREIDFMASLLSASALPIFDSGAELHVIGRRGARPATIPWLSAVPGSVAVRRGGQASGGVGKKKAPGLRGFGGLPAEGLGAVIGVLPVPWVELVVAVVLRPRIGHVALAVALLQVFALLPDVAMLISVPVPVARGIDVPGSYGYVFDHSRGRSDGDINIDPGYARQWVREQRASKPGGKQSHQSAHNDPPSEVTELHVAECTRCRQSDAGCNCCSPTQRIRQMKSYKHMAHRRGQSGGRGLGRVSDLSCLTETCTA